MKSLNVLSYDIQYRVVKLLQKYSDENAKIECRKALAISHILNVSPAFVGSVATERGYRISQCELGQFGSKKIGNFDKETYMLLKHLVNKEGIITCQDAFTIAAQVGLFKVRSTIRNSDIDVINCQLGCFSLKKRVRLKLRLNFNIESKSNGNILDESYFKLLRKIKESKNICEAASELGIDFNKLFDKISTLEKSLGIKCLKSGYDCLEKIQLTDEAIVHLKKFEKLKEDIEDIAFKRFRELFYGDKNF